MKKIEEQKISLQKREDSLRLDLEEQEDKLKKQAVRVGRLALIGGGISLLLFWGYKQFFGKVKPAKSKAKRKIKKSPFVNRIGELLAPYLIRIIKETLSDSKPDSHKED